MVKNAIITLRKATINDLSAINELIEKAIKTWRLPERVKRLSLPSYLYQEHDFTTIELVVAEDASHNVTGVAAWEQADPKDVPEGIKALLLHGIYVDPQLHGQGIGRNLLFAAEHAAQDRSLSGLLVKAQTNAAGFFLAHGMQALEVINERRDYAHRYWKLIKKV